MKINSQTLTDPSSFMFHVEIIKPFGTIESVVEWAKAEITGDWGWHIIETSSDRLPGRYAFYFNLGKDCCAFSLKWS